MSSLTGRVALVTGAAGAGIGRAIARRVAEDGATVVMTDSHERRLAQAVDDVRESTGGTVTGRLLDVGDRGQIVAVAGSIREELGPISILVNNAAMNIIGSIFDYDPEDWDRVVSVNMSGPWMLCRESMRQMRDAGIPGVILNVSTYAPDVGGEGMETPYAVSKGGLNVLTRCCAYEGGPFGIRANTLSMGMVTGTRFTDTLHPDMQAGERSKSPLDRLPRVDDIVEAAAFLISDRSPTITGETVNISAGSHMRY